jgi:hypothetical protein
MREKSDHTMTSAQQLTLWADRLRDLSAMGLHFAGNVYDQAHYRAVQDIAMAMLALATGGSVEQMEPLYHFVFLCQPLNRGVAEGPVHDHETLDARWFPEKALPQAIDPGHRSRIPEAFRVWHGDRRAFFDGSQFDAKGQT